MVTLEIPIKWLIIILVSIVSVVVASVGTVYDRVDTIEKEKSYFEKLAEKREHEGDSINFQRMILQQQYDSVYEDYNKLIDSLKLDYKEHIETKKIITLSDSLWNVYYDQL